MAAVGGRLGYRLQSSAYGRRDGSAVIRDAWASFHLIPTAGSERRQAFEYLRNEPHSE